MAKKMLIDAAHPEETRVAVLDGTRVEDFDFEVQSKRQLRGNIYLAKVTRVEPSLQAAFVEYGGNRHGFLAFTEIHPDYYAIPVADQEAIKAELAEAEADADGENGDDDDEALEERRRRILTRRYNIQEVIRRRQIMLVQVVKEERGNKGAALTTYLSLAGRYCVLMPNTGRGGGISRKITNGPDRKRLKKIATDLDVAQGMGLIIRTAGAKRTKTEIKRDYEYLTRAWETIRDLTLRSVAPALIYEESSLVKRAIRDLYDKDVDEIHVEGENAYKEAKDFVRMLMPSHAKRVQLWRDPTPIFVKSGVEKQLDSIYSPIVHLRSGGYIVINQAEALVAIDVNSGRATRERNIEQTALKTNIEAADEAARQMRLRDLAGLIVIDFIDMEENKNDRAVEKRMKDNLRLDRARVQMGKISGFGLLELSRQRRRTGVLEGTSHVCPQCQGAGRVRSVESASLALLRAIDDAAARAQGRFILTRAPASVALYVLNEKRESLGTIEVNRSVRLRIEAAEELMPPDYEIVVEQEEVEAEPGREGEGEPRRRPQRAVERAVERVVAVEEPDEPAFEAEAETAEDSESRKRRRRGRRGGKRRTEDGEGAESAPAPAVAEKRESAAASDRSDRSSRRRRRRRGRSRRPFEVDGGEWLDFAGTDPRAYMPRDADPGQGDEAESAEDGAVDDGSPDDAAQDAAPAPYEAPLAPAALVFEHPALEVMAMAAAEDEARVPASAVGADSPDARETATAAQDPADEEKAEPVDQVDYEPDHESRSKFFSRFNRWGKKSG